jgi:hypothetical protein
MSWRSLLLEQAAGRGPSVVGAVTRPRPCAEDACAVESLAANLPRGPSHQILQPPKVPHR